MAERHFKIEPLNIENFIKVNDLAGITNPIFFDGNNLPTTDGLLSNEIFGITRDDRANTFAYINLGRDEPFMHPLFYKIWCKMDSHIRECVHGTKNFSIDKDGYMIEDENGETGIKFLKKNFKKMKIRRTESIKRDNNITFLQKFADRMFINNMVVIPAFYRDVNTESTTIGVGDINKLYNSLIIATRSLKESGSYGFSLADTIRGRIQEILVELYDYFTKGVYKNKPTTGISGKFGVMRRANLSKTTDYSARLVITCPILNVESMDDMIVDVDHSAVPLGACAANFYPYMLFYMRRFFENLSSATGLMAHVYADPKSKKEVSMDIVEPKDFRIVFSDERLKEELDRYIHGYANRLRVIEIPLKKPSADKLTSVYLKFTGYKMSPKDYQDYRNTHDIGASPIIERHMTWCDLIYAAACEVTKDKHVLITRYPMDKYFNQFPSKIHVSSTIKTTPMLVDGHFYRWYPNISEEDIGANTSNMFVDTMKLCNAYLPSIGGDYDGDTISCKPIYTVEANQELDKLMNTPSHFIDLAGATALESSNEARQCLYNLTLVLPEDKAKLSNPTF